LLDGLGFPAVGEALEALKAMNKASPARIHRAKKVAGGLRGGRGCRSETATTFEEMGCDWDPE